MGKTFFSKALNVCMCTNGVVSINFAVLYQFLPHITCYYGREKGDVNQGSRKAKNKYCLYLA